MKELFLVKNGKILWKSSGLAQISSQTHSLDRILKILIKSLFFIKLEVNDGNTGLLFVPLSTLSKHEGTRHPLPLLQAGFLSNRILLQKYHQTYYQAIITRLKDVK